VRRALPEKTAYAVVRWINVLRQSLFFGLCRTAPGLARRLLAKGVERLLPEGVPLDPHFTPAYAPWDQRLCLVPDGDLFRAMRDGTASVVTDRIATFTRAGIELASGAHLDADVVVTATGLNLLALGGMDLAVDGRDVVMNRTVGYKGMMFTGVPNLAIAVGYTNASWTLKCDLTCAYVCRLLAHMDAKGYTKVVPRELAPGTPTRPFIDLKSGYVQRSLDVFPRQGLKAPWRLYQNYARDIMMLKRGPVEDDGIEFSRPAPTTAPAEKLAA
jgi:monooxygenase